MTTVIGRANAACGSATPHQVLPEVQLPVTRMNSGMMATVTGKSSPSTNTRYSGSRPRKR